MLRQVFLYYNRKVIFRYDFALGFTDEDLKTALNKSLASYIEAPVEGRAFSKPLFDYQAHFMMKNGVFFLFITDMADRPKTIQDEIKRASTLFFKNFKNPEDIQNPGMERDEFLDYIKDTHYYLHPKLALAGPLGAGKTTIKNLLAIEPDPEKRIMNFAEYYRIKIGSLFFDLWDFIQNDNFSPLWNNFIRGSDTIFYIFNGAKINDSIVQRFIKLHFQEGKFSNAAIILTHKDSPDFIGKDAFLEKFHRFKSFPIYEIELTAQDALQRIKDIFIEVIKLKKPLPPDFKLKVASANDLITNERYEDALIELQELLKIALDYREYSFAEIFQNKIESIKEKIEERKKQQELEKIKIKAPEKVDFGKFKGVKPLKPKPLQVPRPNPSVKGARPAPPKPAIPIKNKPAGDESPELRKAMAVQNTGKAEAEKPAGVSGGGFESDVNAASPPSKSSMQSAAEDLMEGISATNPFLSGLTSGFNEMAKKTGEQIKRSVSNIPPRPETIPNVSDALNALDSIKPPSTDEFEEDLEIFRSKKAPKKGEIAEFLTPAQKPVKPIRMGNEKAASVAEQSEAGPEKIGTAGQISSQKPEETEDTLSGRVKFRVHSGNKKIKTIDINMLEKAPSRKDSLIQNSLKLLREGIVDNKLTMERSPLVSEDVVGKPKIRKDTQTSGESPTENKPFIAEKQSEERKYSKEAEILGKYIRELGESLSMNLCEKFVKGIKFKLKKTVLTETDLKNAAELYVRQRRRKRESGA